MTTHDDWLRDKQAWLDGGCLCSECGQVMRQKSSLKSWFLCDKCGMVHFYHAPFSSMRRRLKRSVTSVTSAAAVTERSVTADKPKCAVCGKVLQGRLGKKTCSTKCRKRFSRKKD